MKACLLYIVLALALSCNGQQNVVVSVASYLSDFVGGTGTTTCRPAEELILGGPSQLTCQNRGYAVPPRSQGRWGSPSGGTQKSGLGFEGVQGKTVALNTDFFLGNMVHFNYPISQGSAASGIQLNIFFTVTTTAGVQIGTYLYSFQMQVDETLNQTPCVYPSQAGNPCADKIFFGNTLNANTSFTLGQVDYTLQLRGFKESNSSSSSPVQYFISNEQQSSTAFLFARITAACPRTCVNGGSYILSSSNECICDCTNVNCPYTAQVTSPNCTCVCPNPSQCANGAGGVLRPDCTCNCQACPAPLLTNSADCSCTCPANYCGVGTINNPNTCSCNCPQTACPIANEIRDGRCNCVCNLTCQAPKIEDPSASVCGCVCPSTTCPSGYTINPNTCACDCTRTCVNAPLIQASCTCGPCVGNWTLAPNNTCTLCKLNQTSCKPGEGVDAATCSCVCSQLSCDLYNDGLVVDQNNYCSCRPCTAGECYCGNGIVEPGEDCDVGGVANPCCQQCKFTTSPCNDGNGCTQQDTCNGAGQCIGEYKCPPSTDCANITCVPAVGVCVTTNFPENSNCGATPYDLCSRRCVSGVCQNAPVVCDPDTNLDDCMVPVCNPLTGLCPYVPTSDVNYGCSDEDSCTSNDHCVNGTCQGTPVVCPPSADPCKNYVCTDNLCQAVLLSDIPCNADNNSCTVGDYCFQGVCQTGNLTQCSGGDQCKSPYCDSLTGLCQFLILNTSCNDANQCTTNDTCTNGACSGVLDPALSSAVECGGTPPVTPESVNNTSALIFGLTGAAALIGAIAGIAFLVKKVRDSKLLDPETWDPDKFSSVGSNPLYKGSEKTVDNRMYEGSM